ncbi:TPA: hypothetical protein N0F65_000884 [Lagenidium giganteum]|uniref:Polyprotein n=1 Tax=Lagenidium giganteum TaxID=4803 RepID=A0AAV2YZ75_9STRA|nr:TPA: hypothetical protein N0F65_000884 [Lagenidium giganteum]
MSPSTPGANEILNDMNYFLWEYNARMTLARKDLLDHVMPMKQEQAMQRATAEWKAADMKALAVLSKLLSPMYQTMIREATTALEAWETLRDFFVKQSLHNRVRLRKQLHEFQMDEGGNLMEHFLLFDDLCLRLAAVGDRLGDDEKLVILLGSLPSEYDNMVKIVEAHDNVTLQCAKEMLRREFETIAKREKQKGAFKAGGIRNGRHPRDRARGNQPNGEDSRTHNRQGNQRHRRFTGKCFECGREGHKQAQCNQRRQNDDADEYVFSATSENSTTWLLDSGASSHMTFEASDFVELRSLKGALTISIANGHRLPVRGIGTVRLSTPNGTVVRLTDVMYVPELDRKLLSVHAHTAKGVEIRFVGGVCTIRLNDKVIGNVKKCGKLYEWNAEEWSMTTPEVAASSTCTPDANVWHARLGHPSAERLQAAVGAAEGVPAFLRQVDDVAACEVCARGKMTVKPFAHGSGSAVKTAKKLELVHSDVMGPMNPASRGGARYVVTFIDDFSRFTVAYCIKSKSEVLRCFREYKQLVENQVGSSIKCIRTDNGGEYTSKTFREYCSRSGIVHQTSAPYTPQQNGLANRMNRTLMDMARSMLYYQQVEKTWWGEAVQTAVYLTNRLPNTARRESTPYQLFYDVRPRLDHVRVFGARGFVYVDKSKRAKWDAKAHKCVFLGYASDTKGYCVWDVEDERLVVSRTVKLNENPPDAYIDARAWRTACVHQNHRVIMMTKASTTRYHEYRTCNQVQVKTMRWMSTKIQQQLTTLQWT